MPDVSLFTATEPVASDIPVIIRYSVEVGGLPVYNESYDVDKLAVELEEDEARAASLWLRRLKCVIAARHRPGFSAALTRCLADGQCCDNGAGNAEKIDSLGVASKEA
ncbi:hypothetical protein WJU23_15935 [Prosthecobacter sp. SYSU 5D2]|uniref:hypothetical protein n=1 Tax=Prosthecobacter sp. SYSU 5D2 TaxID=3134134 RepID=UPI0031FEE90E